MTSRCTYARLAVLSLFAAFSASATEVAVDFGTPATASPAGWNDARALHAVGTVTLKTTTGASTGYSLTTTKRFTDHQPYGTTTPAAGIPLAAARDGMYGNELFYQEYNAPTGEMEIGGLDATVSYTIVIFASVDRDDTQNRTTAYDVVGATTVTRTLNPTNNTGTTVSATVKPNATTRKIRIVVRKGTGNNTREGFYHVGHFRMTYTLPTGTNQPPVVNATASPSSITLPTNQLTLAANASDSTGTIKSYLWTKTAGGAATFNSGAASPLVTGLVAGSYAFKVKVTDSYGAFTEDTVSFTVNPQPTGTSAPTLTMIETEEVGNNYGYVEYLPRGYTQAAAKSLPLLIFMHGIGEMGEGKRDPNFTGKANLPLSGTAIGTQTYSKNGVPMAYLNKLALWGPNIYIRSGHDLPFVVLSIQQFEASFPDWNMTMVDEFVTFALNRYKIDPKKVHVTGLSLGGGGSLHYALTQPDRIASLVTICSGYYNQQSVALTDAIVANKVAVWAATSINDPEADFHSRLRKFVTNMGYSLHGSTDILYHFTNPDGIVPTGTNPENVSNLFGYFPTPLGAWSATFNSATHRWDWRAGQEYRTPSGGLPTYPMHFTLYTDTTSHQISPRMYNDPKVYEWILRQSR